MSGPQEVPDASVRGAGADVRLRNPAPVALRPWEATATKCPECGFDSRWHGSERFCAPAAVEPMPPPVRCPRCGNDAPALLRRETFSDGEPGWLYGCKCGEVV